MPANALAQDHTVLYDVASHGDYHAFSFKEKYYFYDINNVNVYEITDTLFYKLNQFRNGSDFFNRFISALHIKDNALMDKHTYSRGVMSLSLNVAQVCNLSCVYCYGVDGEYGTKGLMTKEIAFKSVDFLITQSKKEVGIKIHFFGGEPLLNFSLMKKVVDYSLEQSTIAGKKLAFAITTNGTRFSDEVNEFLNYHKFNVIVSFDGDEDIQDKNRPFKNGKGSYSSTKPKIEKFLKSRNGNASARATVTNHTHDLSELKNRLKAIGFNHVGATVATLSEFATENRVVDKIDEEQKFNLLLESDNNAADFLTAVKNRDKSAISELSDNKAIRYLMQLQNKNKSYFSCGVGRGLLAISITGDIYPCHRFVGNDEFKLGHVTTYDPNSSDKYADSPTQTHPVCSNCWAKYYCGGVGCIHDNYVTKGDVNNINIDHCTRLKNDVKNAIYIYSLMSTDDKQFLFDSKKSRK